MVHPVKGTTLDANDRTSMMWATGYAGDDDESSRSSSDPNLDKTDGPGRKRKTYSEQGDDEDEREVKKRKNREAAKRCRDKKQQQTEDLRSKNSELEKENCELAKQRDDLIRKCREYQAEIEQHKNQGCLVPHFSPPYDLDQILNPQSPPSPSCSEAGHAHSSASASPAPSVSPAPPPRARRGGPGGHEQVSPTAGFQMVGLATTPAVAVPEAERVLTGGGGGDPAGMMPAVLGSHLHAASSLPAHQYPAEAQQFQQQQLQETVQEKLQPQETEAQVHYVKARLKDGSTKTLCLSHEDYLKVKAAQKLKAQQRAIQEQQQHLKNAVGNTQAAFMQNATEILRESPSEYQPAPVLQNPSSQAAPKKNLDTFDDLINVLEKQAANRLELVPVNPNEIFVKEEPSDVGYERQTVQYVPGIPEIRRARPEVKQEEDRAVQLLNSSHPSNNPQSTGQFIRAGLEAITNPDEPGPSNSQIQNILHFLEQDENAFTVMATDPKTAQVLEQTVILSAAQGTLPQPIMVKSNMANPQASVGQRVSYTTTSAGVGSLTQAGRSNIQPINHLEMIAQLRKIQEQQSQIQRQQVLVTSAGNIQQNGLVSVSGTQPEQHQPQQQQPQKQPRTLSISSLPVMPNVKLRPSVTQPIVQSFSPGLASAQTQAVIQQLVSSTDDEQQAAQAVTVMVNASQPHLTNSNSRATSVSLTPNQIQQQRLQQITNSSWLGVNSSAGVALPEFIQISGTVAQPRGVVTNGFQQQNPQTHPSQQPMQRVQIQGSSVHLQQTAKPAASAPQPPVSTARVSTAAPVSTASSGTELMSTSTAFIQEYLKNSSIEALNGASRTAFTTE